MRVDVSQVTPSGLSLGHKWGVGGGPRGGELEPDTGGGGAGPEIEVTGILLEHN